MANPDDLIKKPKRKKPAKRKIKQPSETISTAKGRRSKPETSVNSSKIRKLRTQNATENFKLNKQQQAELTKLRKRASSKQSRIKKRYGYDIQRPVHGRSFATDQEYQQFIRQLQDYTSRESHKFQKIGTGDSSFFVPSEEIQGINDLLKKYENERMKFYKNVADKDIIAGGQLQPDNTVLLRAMMKKETPGSTFYDLLHKQTFEPKEIKSIDEFNRIKSRLERQSKSEYWQWRQEVMYNNFIESLQKLSERSNVGSGKLQEMIRSMPKDKFLEMYYRAESDLSSVFNNTPDSMEFFESVIDIFNNVANAYSIVMSGR